MSLPSTSMPAIRPPTGDYSGEQLERYARNPNVTESDKVSEAARQFEAVLVRQILSAARKTVIHSGLEKESATTEIYKDMINSQLAEAITGAGGLGLARSLELQVRRPNQDGDKQETAPEGDQRSVNGHLHNGFRARHD